MSLNEVVDQLGMESRVRWYDNVLRREDGHVLRRAFKFEVEGQRMKCRLVRTWTRQFMEESMTVALLLVKWHN